MKKVKIEFTTVNDAFKNDLMAEVVKTIKSVADAMEYGINKYKIYDTNGNVIGTAKITD